MLLVRIDVGLLLLSCLGALFTFWRALRRSTQEKQLARDLMQYTSKMKRHIFRLTAEERRENPVEKAVESLQDWMKRKKPIDDSRQEKAMEAKNLFRKAEVYQGRGDMETAEKYLVQALAIDETNKDINKKLALLYLKQEKYPKAEFLYLKLVEMGTKDATVYSNLGLTLYRQSRPDMAIKAYQKAIELDPKRPARYANIGQIYYELQDIHNAVVFFEQAAKLEAKNTDYFFILAKLYEELNVKEKAKFFYHKVLDIDPYNKEAKEGIKKLL